MDPNPSQHRAAVEMLDDLRRLAVEVERQFQAWQQEPIGSADASIGYEALTKAWRRLEHHQSQVEPLLAKGIAAEDEAAR